MAAVAAVPGDVAADGCRVTVYGDCRRLHRTVALDRTEATVATVAAQRYAALIAQLAPRWPTITTADACR